MIGKKYSSESINKPAKRYNPDLHLGRPLWEEEVNDTTGQVIGWLSLFHIAGTEEFLVKYYDIAKRTALTEVAEAEAEAATEQLKAERAAVEPPPELLEPDGEMCITKRDIWELDHPEPYVAPKLHNPAEWIYDITDNKLGQFIIAGWKALNPEEFEALPKTPEEEHERGRKAWEEELALRAAEAHS